MGSFAVVVTRFGVEDLESGILQQAAHPVCGPVVGLANCMIKRLGWHTPEKANEQVPLWPEYPREFGENLR